MTKTKKICYIIMPFSKTDSVSEEEWLKIYNNLFKPIIEDPQTGYECKKSELDTGSFTKEIVMSLKDADVVLADITDYNHNVMWELGVRHALSKRTIMVAREEMIEKIPSDIKNYGVIPYQNTITGFLESTEKKELFDGISKLKQYRKSLDHSTPKQIEAVSSKIYFREYSKLIDERFQFSKRNSFQIAKNNATDVINALLNYGYTVLAGEISKFVNGIGLDAYYGFYHHNHTSFQSLVYDIIESFRWLVECAVWKLSVAKSKNRISKKQYAFTRDGKVILDSELIRKFLEMLERVFQKERKYDYKFGLKTRDGLKSVQEITIVKITVQNMADYCLGKIHSDVK